MSITQNLKVCTNIARNKIVYSSSVLPVKNFKRLHNVNVKEKEKFYNFCKENLFSQDMLLKVRDASEEPGCKSVPNCRLKIPKNKGECPSPPGKDPCKVPDPCRKINNSCKKRKK